MSHPVPEDPVLISARREAVVAFAIWFLALVYTVGYCTRFGYGRTIEDIHFVLGFPDWVFWGIVTPWAVCIVTSIIFGGFIMRDEDLGADPEGNRGVDYSFGEEEQHA